MTAPAHVPQDRPSKLMDAARLICPRCGKPIRRLTVSEGHGHATCDNVEHGQKCGQHLFFIAYGDGVVTVMPTTKTEHEVLAARPTTKRQCLILLGVLRSRDESHVPTAKCRGSCGKTRKRYDLFNGVCRWCITGDPAPGDAAPYTEEE